MFFRLYFTAFLLTICTLCLTSCGNDEKTENEMSGSGEKLQEVAFTINSPGKAANNSTTLKTFSDVGIKEIHYIAYLNEYSGTATNRPFFIRTKKIAVGSLPELTVKDSLPQGQYTIAIITSPREAADGDFVFNNTSSDIIEFPYYTADAFYYSFELTVNNSTKTIAQNVPLQHVMGEVRVIIKDAQKLPAGVNWLLPQIKGYIPKLMNNKSLKTVGCPVVNYYAGGTTGYYNNGWGDDGYISRAAFTAKGEYVMSLFLLDNVDEITAESATTAQLYLTGSTNANVTMRDANILFSKVITTDLKVYRNKVTQITLNLFDNNGSLNVDFDESWGETTIIPMDQ